MRLKFDEQLDLLNKELIQWGLFVKMRLLCPQKL